MSFNFISCKKKPADTSVVTDWGKGKRPIKEMLTQKLNVYTYISVISGGRTGGIAVRPRFLNKTAGDHVGCNKIGREKR